MDVVDSFEMTFYALLLICGDFGGCSSGVVEALLEVDNVQF